MKTGTRNIPLSGGRVKDFRSSLCEISLYSWHNIYLYVFQTSRKSALFSFSSSTFSSYLYRKTKGKKEALCVFSPAYVDVAASAFIAEDFERAKKSQSERSIVPDRQKRQGRERLLPPPPMLLPHTHTHTDPYIAGSGNSISVSSPSKQEKQTRKTS